MLPINFYVMVVLILVGNSQFALLWIYTMDGYQSVWTKASSFTVLCQVKQILEVFLLERLIYIRKIMCTESDVVHCYIYCTLNLP